MKNKCHKQIYKEFWKPLGLIQLVYILTEFIVVYFCNDKRNTSRQVLKKVPNVCQKVFTLTLKLKKAYDERLNQNKIFNLKDYIFFNISEVDQVTIT